MSETHINTYFQDVEDKKVALAKAKGDLDAAEAALEAKKDEVGFEDPAEVKEEKEAEADEAAEESKPEEPVAEASVPETPTEPSTPETDAPDTNNE